MRRALIAIGAALGASVIAAALSYNTRHLESLMHPRTAIRWIPLVMACCTAVGLRAAFFLPSELPASWSFHVNAPDSGPSYWAAVRASMMAFVVPPTLLMKRLSTVSTPSRRSGLEAARRRE